MNIEVLTLEAEKHMKDVNSIMDKVFKNPNQTDLLDGVFEKKFYNYDDGALKEIMAAKSALNELKKKIKKLKKLDPMGAVDNLFDYKHAENYINEASKAIAYQVDFSGHKDRYSRSHVELSIKTEYHKDKVTFEKHKSQVKKGINSPSIQKKKEKYGAHLFFDEFTTRQHTMYQIITRVLNHKMGKYFEKGNKEKGSILKLKWTEFVEISGLSGKLKERSMQLRQDLFHFGDQHWLMQTNDGKVSFFRAFAEEFKDGYLSLTFTPSFLESLGNRGFVVREPLYLVCQRFNKQPTKAMNLLLNLLAYFHADQNREQGIHTYNKFKQSDFYNSLNLVDEYGNERPNAKRDLEKAFDDLEEMGYIKKPKYLTEVKDGKKVKDPIIEVTWNPLKFEGAEKAQQSLSINTDYKEDLESLLTKFKTKTRLAERLGIDRATLHRWIKGELNPKIEHRKKIRELNKELSS